MATAGHKMMNAKFTEMGLQHSYSTLGAMDETEFRNCLYFQTVKPDLSDPHQCSSNHRNFSLCLFPEILETVSIVLCTIPVDGKHF